jgi:hypothetical protein
MLKKANYKIIENDHQRIRIQDLGPWDEHMTVEDDGQTVVTALDIWLGSRRLELVSRDGICREILVFGGKYTGTVG